MKDEADVGAAKVRQCVVAELAEFFTADRDRTACGVVQPAHEVQQCAFSAARGAKQHDELTRLDRERDLVQHRQLNTTGGVAF